MELPVVAEGQRRDGVLTLTLEGVDDARHRAAGDVELDELRLLHVALFVLRQVAVSAARGGADVELAVAVGHGDRRLLGQAIPRDTLGVAQAVECDALLNRMGVRIVEGQCPAELAVLRNGPDGEHVVRGVGDRVGTILSVNGFGLGLVGVIIRGGA